jgi:hypothetical protein
MYYPQLGVRERRVVINMVTVVEPTTRIAKCNKCQSLLQFNAEDESFENSDLYFFNTYSIICPKCGAKVTSRLERIERTIQL